MPTANENLRDSLVRHQVGIMRAIPQTRDKVIALLDASERDISDQIVRRLADVAGGGTTVDFSEGTLALRRLQFLEQAIAAIRANAMTESMDLLDEQMRELTQNEAEFAANTVHNEAPVVLDVTLPSVGLLNSIVEEDAFQGKVLADWAARMADEDLNRINDAIRIGMIQGDSNVEIARRVVGTDAFDGADGATQVTRNQVDSLVRTATNFYSNRARTATYEANSDIVSHELYVATLDSRTTPQCAALDGQVFPVGEGPIPPVHWGCRSTRVPVIGDELLGSRPAKRSTEKDLVSQFKDENGIDTPGSTRDSLPHGTKGTYDDFARQQVRELTGTVPAAQTYQEFLRGQTVNFQNDVLGVTKAQLFRRGGLDLSRFTNRAGDDLTLSQLASRDAAAFRKAGLDPKTYR